MRSTFRVHDAENLYCTFRCALKIDNEDSARLQDIRCGFRKRFIHAEDAVCWLASLESPNSLDFAEAAFHLWPFRRYGGGERWRTMASDGGRWADWPFEMPNWPSELNDLRIQSLNFRLRIQSGHPPRKRRTREAISALTWQCHMTRCTRANHERKTISEDNL